MSEVISVQQQSSANYSSIIAVMILFKTSVPAHQQLSSVAVDAPIRAPPSDGTDAKPALSLSLRAGEVKGLRCYRL